MKNYFLSLSAIILAIMLSAFTAPPFALISFHYIPANGGEFLFEDDSNWEVRASHPECTGIQNDVCILRIDDSKLLPYAGTNEQKLTFYLADQDGTGDYTNATTAVNALAISKKP